MQLLEYFKQLTANSNNVEELKGLILQLAIEGKLIEVKNQSSEKLSELIEFTKNGFSGKPNDDGIGVLRLGIECVTQSDSLVIDVSKARYIEIDDSKRESYDCHFNDIFICRQNGNLRFVGKAAVYKGNSNEVIFSDSLIQIRPKYELIDSSYLALFLSSIKCREEIESYCSTTAGNYSVNGMNLKKVTVLFGTLEEQKAIVDVVNKLFAEVEQLESLTKERIQLKEDFVTSALNQLTKAAESDVANHWELVKSQFSAFFTEKSSIKKLREAILQLAVQGKLTRAFRESYPELCEGSNSAAALLAKIKAEKEQLIKAGKIKKEKPLPPITEDEIPYDLPEGWVWSNIESVCNKVTDGFHHTPSKLESGFKYISATHVKEGGILWNECLFIGEKEHTELYKKAKPSRGDILIVNRGAGCGTPAIVDIDEPFSFQNAALIGFNQSLIDPLFMNFYVLQKRSEIMGNFTNGGAQPMLSNKVLKTLMFPFPPFEEQKVIVEKVNGLMSLCDQLEQEIETHQTTQKHWMQSCLREVV